MISTKLRKKRIQILTTNKNYDFNEQKTESRKAGLNGSAVQLSIYRRAARQEGKLIRGGEGNPRKRKQAGRKPRKKAPYPKREGAAVYIPRASGIYSHCGDDSREDPPVLIPNTEVKLSHAESTLGSPTEG